MSSNINTKKIVLLAALGGLIYGIDTGTIAIILPYIRFTENYSIEQLGLITGILMFGSLFSSIFVGHLTNWLGRKKVIIFGSLLFALSVPITVYSGCINSNMNLYILLSGRVVQGFSVGIISVVVPMYVSENLPIKKRGIGTSIFQLILTLGIVLMAVLGFIISAIIGAPVDELKSSETINCFKSAWQGIYLCLLLPGVTLLIYSFTLKESPIWLAQKNNKKNISKTQTFKDKIFQKKYIIPFVLTTLVFIFNQMTGINSILYYSLTIFKNAGLGEEFANIGDFIIKLVNFIITAIALLFVERKGRKFLLKNGVFIAALGLIGLAIMFYIIDQSIISTDQLSGYITLAFIIVFIAGFAAGPGVCGWLVLTEILPSRIKVHGMAIVMIINQLAMATQLSIFPTWLQATSFELIFGTFAVSTVLYYIVIKFFLPETKGKTEEEIQSHFK